VWAASRCRWFARKSSRPGPGGSGRTAGACAQSAAASDGVPKRQLRRFSSRPGTVSRKRITAGPPGSPSPKRPHSVTRLITSSPPKPSARRPANAPGSCLTISSESRSCRGSIVSSPFPHGRQRAPSPRSKAPPARITRKPMERAMRATASSQMPAVLWKTTGVRPRSARIIRRCRAICRRNSASEKREASE